MSDEIILMVDDAAPIELSLGSQEMVRLGINEQIINSGGGSLSDEAKQALLAVIQNVAFINGDGQDYYDALYAALYPPTELDYITAVYTQSGTVYDTDTLDDLKPDLVVTAFYDDGTSGEVSTYTLSGTLTEGTSTITVSYGGKTDTFSVNVSSKYTFYDYIAMTYADNATIPSNSGLHTNIPFTSDQIMETSLYYSSSINNNACVMGIRNGSSGTKEFGMFCNGNGNRLGYWYGGTDSTKMLSYLVRNQVNEIIVQPVGVSQSYPTNATFKINGTDYDIGSTATGQTWHSWLSFFKYGISSTSTSTGTSDKYCTAQIGETKIKDLSNNLIHDLKPAYDGEHYGLYDAVTDSFYYNSTYADKYICGNWS